MKVGRLAEISRVFLEEGLSLHGEREGSRIPSSDREKAVRLRKALERLGPTFVKFGQLLATRLDLFSPEFLSELSQLRSHVAPFPTEAAKQTLARALGKDWQRKFAEFPDEPVASASMAQVYRARLRDENEWVAVKVARPGLREALDLDLEIIVDLSRTLDTLLPVYHRSMVHRVAIEYAARSRQEADLLSEAQAMEHFVEIATSVGGISVPRVHMDMCAPSVLVMQWLDGNLLDEVDGEQGLRSLGVEPRDLCLSVLRLQLVMSYEFGFVHGDTHPGNLIVLPAGHLGLIDFGLHGQVPRKLCDQMLELLLHQSSGRTEEAIFSFEQIFTAPEGIDKKAFEAELRQVLEETPSEESSQPLTGQLVSGLRLGARYGLRAQSELFLVLRNLTIVEGILLGYCPHLDVVAEAQTILQEIMMRRALSGFKDSALADVAPMALLNLSKRPQLVQGLLRLERSFSDARDLGEFLEKEGVFAHQPQQKKQPLWMPLVIGVLGALVTSWILGALQR